jgi:glucosylceramidase
MRDQLLISFISLFIGGCHVMHYDQQGTLVRSYVTTADQRLLLHADSISFSEQHQNHTLIHIDTTQKFQEVEGFGYTLTGGSATLINTMSAQAKEKLLQELFSKDNDALQISYLRISIGASDLHPIAFSYDDPPTGIVDTHLQYFNLGPDTAHILPVLKRILEINPHLRIMATPWSAPAWMKGNKSSIGGSLLPEYYETYATYFVKYIQEMLAHGITIDGRRAGSLH